MTKKHFALWAVVIGIMYGWTGWTIATKASAYQHLTVIPIKESDIPLYKGLQPKTDFYAMEGIWAKEIQAYYGEALVLEGWTINYTVYRQDWAGFKLLAKKGERFLPIESNYTVYRQDGAGFKLLAKKGERFLTIESRYNVEKNETSIYFGK